MLGYAPDYRRALTDPLGGANPTYDAELMRAGIVGAAAGDLL